MREVPAEAIAGKKEQTKGKARFDAEGFPLKAAIAPNREDEMVCAGRVGVCTLRKSVCVCGYGL